MISRDWCVMMARYNEWMNRRLYALVATLPEDDRIRERGAFFGSIHATLDHIVYADLAFLSRFTGDPPEAPALGVVNYPKFDELRAVRERLDARLREWCGALDAQWLEGELGYTSKVLSLIHISEPTRPY